MISELYGSVLKKLHKMGLISGEEETKKEDNSHEPAQEGVQGASLQHGARPSELGDEVLLNPHQKKLGPQERFSTEVVSQGGHFTGKQKCFGNNRDQCMHGCLIDSFVITYCSLPGSSVHGISQARVLEWVAISFSRGSSQPRDRNCVSSSPALAGGFFTGWAISGKSW